MSRRVHVDQQFRDETTLLRLMEHLEHAIQDTQLVRDAEAFRANRVVLNSVAMELIQAREAANRLSPNAIESIPDLPWNQLCELRNIIVHEYDEIDAEALYRTAIYDLPAMAELLKPITHRIKQETIAHQHNNSAQPTT